MVRVSKHHHAKFCSWNDKLKSTWDKNQITILCFQVYNLPQNELPASLFIAPCRRLGFLTHTHKKKIQKTALIFLIPQILEMQDTKILVKIIGKYMLNREVMKRYSIVFYSNR